MLTARFDELEVRRGHVLLDLGCGAGRHTFEALRRGAHTVSCDLDGAVLGEVRSMVAAMREAGEVDPGTRSAVVRGDARRLPFDDASFDRVIASEVLEHIPDDGAAIREMERVLKPGGRAAVTVPRWWPELVCWSLSRRYRTSAGGHVRVYRRRQLTRRLSSGGLRHHAMHHAHALHSPYWWLRCLTGIDRDAWIARAYHRILVWDITRRPRATRVIERVLNPVLGKSLVVYVSKGSA